MSGLDVRGADEAETKVRVVLCGIGGYGEVHIRMIRQEASRCGFHLVAAVDPAPERSGEYVRLKEEGVPIFPTLSDFFQQGRCDLVILVSPMQFHCEQTCEALRNGAHVLCEKPLCSTEAEAETMAECERTSGRKVLVGYQWSYSAGITQLKSDILSGRFGQPKELKTLVCWPRGQNYYQRNRWAGRLRDAQGRAILDSPVNNATAHYLHNMLYVIGDSVDTSAWPERVEGRLFRANPIENYDTAALKITTSRGVNLWFFTTHASAHSIDPTFVYEFEKATVTNAEGQLRAILASGEVINYESPAADPAAELRQAIDVVRGAGIVRCGITAARAHTRCVILAQESLDITDFPPALISRREEDDTQLIYVDGLLERMVECFESASWQPLNQAFPSAVPTS
jgi:predicted dehydrogenase